METDGKALADPPKYGTILWTARHETRSEKKAEPNVLDTAAAIETKIDGPEAEIDGQLPAE